MWMDQIDFLRRKHEECQEMTYIWTHIESDVELKELYIYQPQFEIDCHKGELISVPSGLLS